MKIFYEFPCFLEINWDEWEGWPGCFRVMFDMQMKAWKHDNFLSLILQRSWLILNRTWNNNCNNVIKNINFKCCKSNKFQTSKNMSANNSPFNEVPKRLKKHQNFVIYILPSVFEGEENDGDGLESWKPCILFCQTNTTPFSVFSV